MSGRVAGMKTEKCLLTARDGCRRWENMKQIFSVFALLTLGVTSGCVPKETDGRPPSWPGLQLGFPPPIWYKPSKPNLRSYHGGSDQKEIEAETEEESKE